MQLKQFRIREMECEFNKRETELLRYLQIQQQYEDEKGKLYSENRKLEAEIETLRRNYEFIDKEVQNTKADNEVLKNKLKDANNILEDAKDKESLLMFYKEKVDKCDEILKLQELNLTVSLC
jgi:septal ring factor EnvC (AmiA/AmiB activator)